MGKRKKQQKFGGRKYAFDHGIKHPVYRFKKGNSESLVIPMTMSPKGENHRQVERLPSQPKLKNPRTKKSKRGTSYAIFRVMASDNQMLEDYPNRVSAKNNRLFKRLFKRKNHGKKPR